MGNKDKLKKVDIRFFLIPFTALTLVFAGLTYYTVRNYIQERYINFENVALSIADSYSHALINSTEAYEIISELLNEKLMVASQAIMLIEDKKDSETLSRLAEKFQIDDIHLYNDKGEIIYSKDNKYIGWKAYNGHPVYDFMISDQDILVENIRQDTESDVYYKYGYVKSSDGMFVQIGVLADNIQNILQDFEIQQIINDISDRSGANYLIFINTEFEVIASSLPQYVGRIIENEDILNRISKNELEAVRTVLDSNDVFQICVPILSESQKIGTLSIAWTTSETDAEVRDILVNGFAMFFIVIITIGCILYYAYRKNKSNIKIAYYDKLTGLPNGEYLSEYLHFYINNLDKGKKAVLLLNCTNFKTLNITYGYTYGDQILLKISEKVKDILDPKDMFFRFSSDRFVLVLHSYTNRNELKHLAQKIVDIFKNLFEGGTEHQYVNAEIGIVEILGENFSVDKVLQDASLALSYTKNNLNNCISFYNQEMEVDVQREERIIKTLRAIILGPQIDSFYLEFQPKLDIKANKVIGFEALARLKIEGLGNISPIEFIDIAERKLLIYELGNQIISRACGFINKLKNLGFYDVRVAVNISGIQLLRDEFIDIIKDIINVAGVDMSYLEFEITESVLLDNFNLINEKLREIKELGISISLDDFGTGFSSLSRLNELNVDSVKIDKYFVDKIDLTKEEDFITADIISMSHKIGLTVVAEGVEEERQKEYLKNHDCDIIQGYFLSKPLSENKAIDFLIRHNK